MMSDTRPDDSYGAEHQVRSKTIRFYFRGEIVELSNVPPTRTLLEWLREDARCTGTKEGCAEGDCGACTVLVAELKDDGAGRESDASLGRLTLRPMNACIKFLPTLDGCALYTVEDLETIGRPASAAKPVPDLHPVQQAMVDCHGSQCGFCTPGFVMTLTATYEHHSERRTVPTRRQISDDIAGNLCRCTGYRPILDAGARMFELPKARIDTDRVADVLETLKAVPLAGYEHGGVRYFSPRTLEEFAELRAAQPAARLLSGATDIGLWVNKQMKELGDILYIGGVNELKRIHEDERELVIGAGVPLQEAWAAIAAHWPEMREVWLRFASPPIRHAGTLGGNVANGSPIGDGPPVLMALRARIVLRHRQVEREMPLEEFYLDYMKNAMQPGEFIQAIKVPLPSAGQVVRAYKVSKRYDSDISAVCAAFALEIGDAGVVRSVRLALGGMAAIARRATGAEAAIVGRVWDEGTMLAAREAIGSDFTPLTDLRASAGYRQSVVRGLLERFWLETRAGGAAPLPPERASVFAFVRQ